jgi:hypothetical protein
MTYQTHILPRIEVPLSHLHKIHDATYNRIFLSQGLVNKPVTLLKIDHKVIEEGWRYLEVPAPFALAR